MIMTCNQPCFETSETLQVGTVYWKEDMSSFCLLLFLANKTRWAGGNVWDQQELMSWVGEDAELESPHK